MRGGCRDNYCGQQALGPVIPGFKPWVSSINYSPPPLIYGVSPATFPHWHPRHPPGSSSRQNYQGQGDDIQKNRRASMGLVGESQP